MLDYQKKLKECQEKENILLKREQLLCEKEKAIRIDRDDVILAQQEIQKLRDALQLNKEEVSNKITYLEERLNEVKAREEIVSNLEKETLLSKQTILNRTKDLEEAHRGLN